MATATRATTPSPPETTLTPASLRTPKTGASDHPQLRLTQSETPNNDPSGLSQRLGKAHLSPNRAAALPLTGAAAMAEIRRRKQQQQGNASFDSRQTSPNPAVAAMQSLMGQGGTSKPTDAPATNKLSEPMRTAAEKISVPDANERMDTEDQVSPVSLGSFGTIESTGTGSAMTATANDDPNASGPAQQFVAEPGEMNDGEDYTENNGHLAVLDEEGSKATSFSYPGPPPQAAEPNRSNAQGSGPSRGMSLPGYGQKSPKSPATNKRHKCPYCATNFTRHHNLKSHLLTHSQEKPYVCQTCQARFRRLHDLKRHTKLHTGERPHTCDKCGRRFARGDALARHNKGPGGCAGRRSSFGGDGDDDYNGQDGMEGVEYEDGDDVNDDDGRRGSKPHAKRQQLGTPQDPNRQVYRQQSNTYPPPPSRSNRGTMGPPQVVHPGSSSQQGDMSGGQPSPGPGSSMGSGYYGSGQVFAEPGMMTHSPKPLSPGQPTDQHRLSVGDASMANRNRSTSLTTQFQQQHFGRQGDGRTPPAQSNSQFAPSQGAPHTILPPLGVTGQSQGRMGQPTMAMRNMHGHASHQGLPPGNASNPSSLSSHGRSSGSSMREMQDSNDIWGYVRQLESRFSRMQDEYELRINHLRDDLIAVKEQLGQMSQAASYSSEMARQGPYN